MSVSVIVSSDSSSSDSPEVDNITITVSGSARGAPVTTKCSNTRSCSVDVELANTGEANIYVAVDYGCSVRRPYVPPITAGKLTKFYSNIPHYAYIYCLLIYWSRLEQFSYLLLHLMIYCHLYFVFRVYLNTKYTHTGKTKQIIMRKST